jgi:hypothetical protein
MLGYVDVALGRFPDRRDLLAGVRRVIVKHWGKPAFEMDPPQRVVACGLASEDVVRCWVDEVWSEDDDD